MNKSPHVLLIYTGGTIGMIENPTTRGLEAFDFAYIEQQVPEIKQLSFDISINTQIPPCDSSDVGPEFWVKIAEVIQNEYHKYDGFVILHGTDTMAYTASALSFMLEGLRKPVLLTGSQLPVGRIRTDGRENLLSSLEIAASQNEHGDPCVQEVCVFFNNQLLRGNRSSKTSADHFLAFESPNYPKLASVGIEIEYDEQLMLPRLPKGTPFKVHTKLDPSVLVVRLFPGISESGLRTIFESPKLKGVVLETYGSGNAPSSRAFLDVIKEAIDRGIVIVNVTQCLKGKVQMNRYETGQSLLKAGVVSGYDMTTEATIVKLMFLLGNCQSVEEVKRGMATSLRGELSL